MEEIKSQERKVVIGIDDSEWSEKAFDYYLQNVHRNTDQVTAVHCVEPIHPPALPHAMASPEWKEHLDKHQQKLKHVEEKYKAKGEANRLRMKIKIVSGSGAGAAICKEAKADHASIIVVGSRGAGILRRTVLGSVSNYVVHHAHVPVLVCPKPHTGHNSPFESPLFGRKKGSPKGSPKTEKKI